MWHEYMFLDSYTRPLSILSEQANMNQYIVWICNIYVNILGYVKISSWDTQYLTFNRLSETHQSEGQSQHNPIEAY